MGVRFRGRFLLLPLLSRSGSDTMVRTALKKYLPEPVKRPLRSVRNRVQQVMIERFFRKTLSVGQLNRMFRRNRYWYLATYADNQLISRHNCDFLMNESFVKAYQFASEATKQERPYWSAYLLQWAAQQAARVDGDFVECGTARGFAAASILSSVDLAALKKRFFLFDSWEGLLVDQLTEHERTTLYGNRLGRVNQDYSGYYEEVKRTFAPFPYVSLVKGYVPASLSQVEIPRVGFLHIDMNAVYPEVEALRYFWPRLTRGGWVILDDYGQPGREEQKQGMDRLAAELRIEIFSSPTGQGVLIKA